MRLVKEIIIHCSASSITGQTAALMKEWHEERGMRTIGYHVFIRNNGLIEQGREWDEVGAHCYGHNQNSIGICLAGKEIRDFTPAQFDSLRLLLKLLKKSIPPPRFTDTMNSLPRNAPCSWLTNGEPLGIATRC